MIFFTAMPNFSHRAPGLVGLMAHDDLPDDLYFGLIADLVHTHPEAIILAARLQGDRIILIRYNTQFLFIYLFIV